MHALTKCLSVCVVLEENDGMTTLCNDDTVVVSCCRALDCIARVPFPRITGCGHSVKQYHVCDMRTP